MFNRIVVIGQNDFGIEIARELSISGVSVTMVEESRASMPEIPIVSGFLVTPVKNINLKEFDTTILVLDEKMERTLKYLIFFQSLKLDRVLICALNDDHQQVADLYTTGKNWHTIRLDHHIGSLMKNMVIDFSTLSNG